MTLPSRVTEGLLFHVSRLAIMSVGMLERYTTGRHRRTGTASYVILVTSWRDPMLLINTVGIVIPSFISSSSILTILILHVCSGSMCLLLWTVDPAVPGLSPEWDPICYEARSTVQGYPSLHPSGVVHWVPVLSNIKTVTRC